LPSRIAGILDILSDGKWHGIEELQQQMDMDESEVQKIAAFLNKYDFTTVDDANKKVKINKNFHEFLERITS
jgi:DNA-binding IclR family transcriptional regulator